MQALSLPAVAGLHWVRDGFALLRKQPFPMMTLVLVRIFAWLFVGAIPYIGVLIALVLDPGLSAAFMYASRDVEQQRLVMPTRLVSGFQKEGGVAQRMLMLGLAYAIAMCAVALFFALIDGGEFMRMMNTGDLANADAVQRAASPDNPIPPSMQLLMLGSVLVAMLVVAAFWFAPVLVAWHGITPMKAVFFSMVAAWRCRGALLVFALAMFFITLITQASVAIVLTVLGVPLEFQVFVVLPLTTAQFALFYCAAYVSYLDAFGLRESGPPRVDTTA